MFTWLESVFVLLGFIFCFTIIMAFAFIGTSTAYDTLYVQKWLFGMMMVIITIFTFLITKITNLQKYFED